MVDYSTYNKAALRAACKSAGIPYGKLDNAGMRRALENRTYTEEDGSTSVAPAVKQCRVIADGEVSAKVKRAAKKAADAAARAGRGGELSVRDWIAEQVKGGRKLKISDALDFAARTGRSKVTVYRMIRENKHHVVDGMVVRDK